MDIIASKIVGINPLHVAITKVAMESYFCQGRIEDITVVVEKIEEVIVNNFLN